MVNKLADQKYVHGLGINVAPHVDMAGSFFPHATGSVAPRFGITGEWVVSPHWSFETSIDHMAQRYTITRNLSSYALPNVNTELGDLHSARVTTTTSRVTTTTFFTPVNLKYRLWLTQQHQLLFKAGYTPYLGLNRQYVYNYPTSDSSPDSEIDINTISENDVRRFYGGTVNVAAGISHLIKKKNQFEVALFYEKSIGKAGVERLPMQLLGIRAAYSIKIR